jgi:hypothetical protein
VAQVPRNSPALDIPSDAVTQISSLAFSCGEGAPMHNQVRQVKNSRVFIRPAEAGVPRQACGKCRGALMMTD